MKEFAGKKFLLVEENASLPFDTRPWREAVSLKAAGAEVFVICPTPIGGQTKEKFPVINGVHIYDQSSNFALLASSPARDSGNRSKRCF
jgi:hypothetical protein